jgi:hypothetical protein
LRQSWSYFRIWAASSVVSGESKYPLEYVIVGSSQSLKKS